MKYTIELTSKQKKVMDCLVEIIHRYIGFNPKFEIYRESKVITKTITDPNADAIYKQGFEDGKNEVFRNAELIPELRKVEYTKGIEDARQTLLNLLKIPSSEWGSIFDSDSYYVEAILKHYSINEIAQRINTYEEKKKADEESIKIGDEVKDLSSNNIGVVLSVGRMIVYMTEISHIYSNTRGSLEKTGRHFGDEVEQLLSKLKERE